jgi:hypothetical protein
MVAAELRDERYSQAIQLLVIKNYGSTVARNVEVTFDPPLGRSRAGQGAPEPVAVLETTLFEANPLAGARPGTGHHLFDGEGNNTGGGWKNREPHPDQVRVTIELDAPDGTHYIDHFDLDVNLIRDRSMVTSSRHPEERLKRAMKALEDINKALTHIARATPNATQAREAARQNAALFEKLLSRLSEVKDDKHADDQKGQTTRHDQQNPGGAQGAADEDSEVE